MKLWIMRHGEAVDAEAVGGSDEQRILTPDGEQCVTAVAQALARLGIAPKTIWTSPYPRALQTAQIVGKILNRPKAVRKTEALRPGAHPDVIGELLAGLADDAIVMLVGHNPDLEELAGWLISESGRAQIELKKGGVACLRVTQPWRAGGGQLKALWTPKQLARLSK